MRLAQLQQLASSMGITGTAKMRKSDLVAAIKAKQSGEGSAPAQKQRSDERPAPSADQQQQDAGAGREQPREREESREQGREDRRGDERSDRQQGDQTSRDTRSDDRGNRGNDNRGDRGDDTRGDDRGNRGNDNRENDNRGDRGDDTRGDDRGNRGNDNRGNRGNDNRGDDRGNRGGDNQDNDNRGGDNRGNDNRGGDNRGNDNRGGQHNQGNNGPDDQGGGRRRRNRGRNRGRDKRRGGGGNHGEEEIQVHEDDVLVPAAGILDVLDNYAFVRTSGYLPGSNDVYVPLGMVKRNGLRKGDAVTGKVRTSQDGEGMQTVGGKNNRQKYNPLVSLDTVNGMTPDEAKRRPEFGKLTPLYPQQRLRLETDPSVLTTRMIDLVAPIGKGQRGLIVAPAKAGKTMVMQSIANAITTNNPECHLMVVLVDERPEEVTDMQRAVNGEVISSTFDRPADDHTTVAELAIERAKRLVEMGHDVVLLLDSITKLGRAYNLAAPASGRILSGGVDSAALYPPKKFFGAARNIENGGSLTILATALVETGSRMDEVIFEEFKGTGNMELKLDRGLANRRIFPAVDVNASGTRREEILLAPEELKIMWKLRRVLAALDAQQGVELLIDRLKKTKTNYEFLTQVQQTSSIRLDDDEQA
nr:transcription termination factor Rho [Marihabitans asiaticum]